VVRVTPLESTYPGTCQVILDTLVPSSHRVHTSPFSGELPPSTPVLPMSADPGGKCPIVAYVETAILAVVQSLCLA
jgi:hypothetical protein